MNTEQSYHETHLMEAVYRSVLPHNATPPEDLRLTIDRDIRTNQMIITMLVKVWPVEQPLMQRIELDMYEWESLISQPTYVLDEWARAAGTRLLKGFQSYLLSNEDRQKLESDLAITKKEASLARKLLDDLREDIKEVVRANGTYETMNNTYRLRFDELARNWFYRLGVALGLLPKASL